MDLRHQSSAIDVVVIQEPIKQEPNCCDKLIK